MPVNKLKAYFLQKLLGRKYFVDTDYNEFNGNYILTYGYVKKDRTIIIYKIEEAKLHSIH